MPPVLQDVYKNLGKSPAQILQERWIEEIGRSGDADVDAAAVAALAVASSHTLAVDNVSCTIVIAALVDGRVHQGMATFSLAIRLFNTEKYTMMQTINSLIQYLLAPPP